MRSSLLGCSGGYIFNSILLCWLIGSTWSSLVVFPRMPSRSLHGRSAVAEETAFKCWAWWSWSSLQLKWFCVAFLVFWKDLATHEPGDQIPQPVPSVITEWPWAKPWPLHTFLSHLQKMLRQPPMNLVLKYGFCPRISCALRCQLQNTNLDHQQIDGKSSSLQHNYSAFGQLLSDPRLE